MQNNQSYHRLGGMSPTQLILGVLLVVTVVILLTTGVTMLWQSSRRTFAQSTPFNTKQIEEEDGVIGEPWVVMGLKPLHISPHDVEIIKSISAMRNQNGQDSTTNKVDDIPCRSYLWPESVSVGIPLSVEWAEEGQEYILHCEEEEVLKLPLDLPSSLIRWDINGSPISLRNSRYIHMNDGGLKLNRIKEADGGNYTCHYKQGKCYTTITARRINLKVRRRRLN